MAKNYKHWTYKEKTPANGSVYHKNNGKVLLVIYDDSIRLYRDFEEGKQIIPYNAKTRIERKRNCKIWH